MKLNLTAAAGKPAKDQTLVMFATVSKNAKKSGKKHVSKTEIDNVTTPVLELISNSLSEDEICCKASEVTTYRNASLEQARHLAVVGVGVAGDLNHEGVRQAASHVLGAIRALKSKNASVLVDTLPSLAKDRVAFIRALAEGLLLSDYNFDELKSKTKDAAEEEIRINLVTEAAGEKDAKQALQEALVFGETVNFSRRLGDMPGNLMTPAILANETVKAARGTGLKVTVWDKARIKREKMGGLLGVSLGSAFDPRFIIMEYKGGPKSQKPLIFVGKGLTFDCGGVSIKPSAQMEEMKYDMCGGANVIGTMLAIARLKLKVNAIGLVPSTENVIGPAATKPGDVHWARNGKSFEVNNTDAEGRLILADALSYASELDPQMIVDAATLTGAMVIALGNSHTGYYTRNAELKEKVENAAENSGEWVWNMPLCDHHVKDMKGTFADLSNTSSFRGAGSATAAAFLEQFVGEGIPWAHFDIAGTAWSVGNRLSYCPKKGASGVMIRTFTELARIFE
jgi:leucyl aminopeptidase